MYDGQCPKCAATDVRTNPSKISLGYRGVIWALTFWRTGRISLLVCVRCGYTEEYIFSRKDLDLIAEKWIKVPAVKGN